MTVEIKNLQRKYPVNQRLIREKAETILSLCGLDDVELSLLFVNNQRIRALNKRYRGIDKPTDVLAFPMEENWEVRENEFQRDKTSLALVSRSPERSEGEAKNVLPIPDRRGFPTPPRDSGTKPRLLGDIVISMEKTHSQARERGHLPACEILILLTHGILHLIGYDHERSPREERRMRKREESILRRVHPIKL